MKKLIQELETEIGRREKELNTLREALSSFRTMGGENGSVVVLTTEVVHNGSYVGQAVGAAVRRFMQDRRSATLDEIREALTRGGIEWGKYPKRQVKLAVVNSPAIYSVNGDVVTLK